MVGESRDVFTKRMLGEKHISSIMCKNPVGGHGPLAPAADAHVHLHQRLAASTW